MEKERQLPSRFSLVDCSPPHHHRHRFPWVKPCFGCHDFRFLAGWMEEAEDAVRPGTKQHNYCLILWAKLQLAGMEPVSVVSSLARTL
jgi:hypothetical protein